MHIPPKTKLDRIDQTLSKLPQAVYESICDLTVEVWVTPEPTSFGDRRTGKHLSLKPGDVWGELWDCGWFHFTGVVPSSAAGKSVVLLIDLSGEGLVVNGDGSPVQGLTTVSSGFDFSLGRPGKRVVPLANPASGSESIDLWLDAGLNDLFGSLRNGGAVEEASIAIRREDLQALCFDFEVLRELLDQLQPQKARYAAVLQALYEAVLFLAKELSDEAVAAARARLAPELARRGGTPALTVSAIGHAHIDLAWLWPIRETIRKGARTFSTVLRMMERYPEYVFGASQPQLYQWMKDHYPSLYEQVRSRVLDGRWEVQGAMWVEPDANISSGESLVRQLLYGKRFFRLEFGKEVTNLWMPDVFGYSGSIPQILRNAGVDTFLTQKLSWSQFNQHPHHTFHWVGIDGTSVLVHMPPEATYNSSAAPRAIARAENDYLDKDVSDRCLLLFGIGDGGGGPGEEHLERLAREGDLDGLVPVVQEFSETFFDRLKVNSSKYASWHGELYLEKHQGTLTTQAWNKRFNRKLEFALREAELASVRLMMAGGVYPSSDFERIWKEVLLYQFHDILPGSSITRVFDESRARYAELLEEVERITESADRSTHGTGDDHVVINSLSWERSQWIKISDGWYSVTVPAMGSSVVGTVSPEPKSVVASPDTLQNEYLKVGFSDRGEIVSIFDIENDRELMQTGESANRLAVYDDRGDAWDFPFDYDTIPPEHFDLDSSECIVDGPHGIIRQTRKYGESTLVQEICLTAGSRRLDFRTRVDWREHKKMLRTSFPVAVKADIARCEIQFGNIARVTHGNTSWDWAQGEVCAQKWVDLSEEGFGVALLNDCKYGHRVKDGILDLNLLRSPGYPDPTADLGEHEFTYALFPHKGDYAAGGVVRAAYELNVPLRLVSRVSGGLTPLVEATSPNVVVEAIKKAEDSDAVVVRLYEAHGRTTRTVLRFNVPVASVSIVNLMEEDEYPLHFADNACEIELKPFEILSLKLAISSS